MAPPDVLATQVPVASLAGTARTIATSAGRAGYAVRATRALGPRLPRQTGQPVVRAASVAVVGASGRFAFQAVKAETDGWAVTIWKPGWPPQLANTAVLVRMLKAQTPTELKR